MEGLSWAGTYYMLITAYKQDQALFIFSITFQSNLKQYNIFPFWFSEQPKQHQQQKILQDEYKEAKFAPFVEDDFKHFNLLEKQ